MAPITALNSATGCFLVTGGPCRILSNAALRRSAVSSISVTAARSLITATTPVKTATAPSARMTRPEQWLANQQRLLLPVTHFLLTFTLPEELRAVARSHQKTIYNSLFRSSAEALQALAWEPRFVGGRVGMVGVLHTWTRDLRYHPHVHYIVATNITNH